MKVVVNFFRRVLTSGEKRQPGKELPVKIKKAYVPSFLLTCNTTPYSQIQEQKCNSMTNALHPELSTNHSAACRSLAPFKMALSLYAPLSTDSSVLNSTWHLVSYFLMPAGMAGMRRGMIWSLLGTLAINTAFCIALARLHGHMRTPWSFICVGRWQRWKLPRISAPPHCRRFGTREFLPYRYIFNFMA